MSDHKSDSVPLPTTDSFDGFYWIGHPACESPGDEEKMFIDRREEVRLVVGATDEQACYSYHDCAVVMLDGKLWVLSSSGCSCPSPSETWQVDGGPFDAPAEVAVWLKADKDIYLPDNVRRQIVDHLLPGGAS